MLNLIRIDAETHLLHWPGAETFSDMETTPPGMDSRPGDQTTEEEPIENSSTTAENEDRIKQKKYLIIAEQGKGAVLYAGLTVQFLQCCNKISVLPPAGYNVSITPALFPPLFVRLPIIALQIFTGVFIAFLYLHWTLVL